MVAYIACEGQVFRDLPHSGPSAGCDDGWVDDVLRCLADDVAGLTDATVAGELASVGERLRAAAEAPDAAARYAAWQGALVDLRCLAARSDEVACFLEGDAAVLGAMTLAVDVVEAAGTPVDRGAAPAAHLRRAVTWQHRVDSETRQCAADVVRGSLRLLARGAPAPRLRDVRAERVRLGHAIRIRCSAALMRWRAGAADVRRRDVAAFEARVRAEADELLAGVDARVDQLVGVARVDQLVGDALDGPLPGPVLPEPVRPARRGEWQVATVLAAGFGWGVAVALSRAVATPWGGVLGAAVGIALTAWVVRVRGAVATRAVLDRWVTEVAAAVRVHAEAAVAVRLVAAESVVDRLPPGRTGAVSLNRSCERSDNDPINGAHVTRVNLNQATTETACRRPS